MIKDSPNWSEYFHHSGKINLSKIGKSDFEELINIIKDEVEKSMKITLKDIIYAFRKKIKYYRKSPKIAVRDAKMLVKLLALKFERK